MACSDALRDMHRRVRALLVAGTSGLLVVAPATGVPRAIQVRRRHRAASCSGSSCVASPVDAPSPVAPAR